MASKEHNSDNSASGSSGFAQLFLRKLQENLDRKNQNPAPRIVIKEIKSVYAYEIGCMMHTLGDAERPLKESVRYLEMVLRDQMNMLLIIASKVPVSGALTHANLLVLLAKNREKMIRLLHYLFLKDFSELLGKKKYDKFIDAVTSAGFGMRVKTCLEFLKNMNAGDYEPAIIKTASDGITMERIARKFQMSRTMTKEQYFSFTKKQRICFYPKGDRGRFRDWLLDDKVTLLKPTPLALDILSFFARETIAEVVEAALVISLRKKRRKLYVLNSLLKKNSRSIADRQETRIDSDLDAPSSSFHVSGMPGLSNLIANGSDSPSNLRSLVNSGSLGMSDIHAFSTFSLNEKDKFSPIEESPCCKKRKMETKDSDAKSNDEESMMGETISAQESILRSELLEPKIPPRNSHDAITVEELRSAVMNLIMSNPGKISMNKTKRILCL